MMRRSYDPEGDFLLATYKYRYYDQEGELLLELSTDHAGAGHVLEWMPPGTRCPRWEAYDDAQWDGRMK